MQPIVDSCGCHASKQSDSHHQGLVSSLPILYCANSLLYVDFIHGLPKFAIHDICLVVTCGLTCFTRAFPCNKRITGEQPVNILVEQWWEHYREPREVHSAEKVRIGGDTGWYKRLLGALNVHVTTRVPYTHTSDPLCDRQNRVVEQSLWILMKKKQSAMLVTLGVPNHELSRGFLQPGIPPKSCSFGGVVRGFPKPLPRGLQEPCRGLAGTQAGPG